MCKETRGLNEYLGKGKMIMKVYGMTIDGKCAIESNAITSFAYAHGKLDKEIGYDLIWIPNYRHPDEIGEGIYDVDFVYPDGRETKAKLFVWIDRETFPGHGLCIDVTDTEYLKDAQWKYEHHHFTADGWYERECEL